MGVLGSWTGLIIAVWAKAARRFSALRERLPAPVGCSRPGCALAQGLVVRSVAPGPPVRVAYALTPAGRGFNEFARAISRWRQRFVKPVAPARAAPGRKLRVRR
jgi:DNA-binding HxlR family transcriptional regulator